VKRIDGLRLEVEPARAVQPSTTPARL